MMKESHWFIETSDGMRLAATRCGSCGKLHFPKRSFCPNCLGTEQLETTPLSSQGKLYSFTVSRVGRESMEAPYAFGFIDLPEGIRVFSLLTSTEGLREDMSVELVAEGAEIPYRFRPIRGGKGEFK